MQASRLLEAALLLIVNLGEAFFQHFQLGRLPGNLPLDLLYPALDCDLLVLSLVGDLRAEGGEPGILLAEELPLLLRLLLQAYPLLL